MSSARTPDTRTLKQLAALLAQSPGEPHGHQRSADQRPALQQWLLKHRKTLLRSGVSTSLLLPLMAQAAAEQLESGALKAFASLDGLVSAGVGYVEGGQGVVLVYPDGSEVQVPRSALVQVEGVTYVPVSLPDLPADLLTQVTDQGLPAVVVSLASVEGVQGLSESDDGGYTLTMEDGSTVSLGEGVLWSSAGDSYLAPSALTDVIDDESVLALFGAEGGFPWLLTGLGAVGVVGLAAAAGGGGGGSSGDDEPKDTAPPTAPVVELGNDTGSDAGVTSDPALTIEAEAGSTVRVSVDGTYVGDATEDPQNPGTFTYTPSGLADGDYEITVTATDAAGNTSQPSAPLDITLDTQAPAEASVALANDTGADNQDGITSDGTLTITAEPGATVQVYNGQTLLGDATEDPQNPGTFTYTPSGLADGDYEITVTATDAAGNTSQPSAPLDITLDTQAPAEASVTLAQDTGADDSDGITSNGTINVSGVESGASWQYSTDGGTNWTDGNGTDFTLPEGDYAAGDVQVRVVDTAGNDTVTSPPELKIDQTAPAQASVVLANDTGADNQDDITSDGALTITAEPGATVQVYNGQTLLGEATEDSNQPGTFTFDADSLPDGAYTITVTAADSAGNTGAESAPLNIQLDTAAPVSPTVELANDNGDNAADGVTNDGEVQVSGIEAGAAWQYSTDGGTNWTDGQGASFTLPEGDYPTSGVQVRQIDGAGNTSQPTSLGPVTIDTTAPTVAIDVTDIEGLAPGDTGIVTFTFSEAPYDFSLVDVTRPGNLELTDLQAVNADGTEFQAVARTIDNSGITGERITVSPDWQDLAGNPSAQLAESAAFDIAPVNPLIVGGTGQHFATIAEALDYSSAGDTVRLQQNSYDITGLTPDQQNALELLNDIEMGEGARLQLTADQADGELISAEDTSSIVIADLGAGDYDFSNLSVADGKIATTVDADLTVGGAANLGDLIIGVNAGATVTMTAAQASGRRMNGEGNVEVTDLEATLDADLSAITTDGALTVYFEDSSEIRTFTGQLGQASVMVQAGTVNLSAQADVGSASFLVDNGAGLKGSAGQLDGVSVAGQGGYVTVNGLAANTDLSGMGADLQVAVTVYASLDLRANQNLDTVDLYSGNPTLNLTLSAEQADGVSIDQFGGVKITDLAATPNASFTGINSPTTIQVTNDVTFTGDLGNAAVTVSAGRTLTTDAGKVSGLDISGSGELALTGTIDGSFDPDNFTIDQVDLTGATLDFNFDNMVLNSSSQFTLLPEQVDQLDLTGNDDANTLIVDVSGLDYSGGTVDLSDVFINTLGGDDLVRFDFGAGVDTRTLRPVGTLTLGDGIDTLEISNGTVDLSGLTITGLENFVINSNITIAADTFYSLLDGMDPTTGSGLFGSGTITVTGTLSGTDPIDLNQLGQFEPGGTTAPTIKFPAGYIEGVDYKAPDDTGSLLKIEVGGVTDPIFNGVYTPDSATVYNSSQLKEGVNNTDVQQITLANDITLNEPLNASRSDLTFDFSQGNLLLGTGGELTLSVAQADTAIVGGTGTVIITGASGTLNSDFAGLTNDNVILEVSDPLDVTQASLDGINYNVQAAGELTVAASQLSGSSMEGTGSVRILLDDLQADLSTLGLGSGLNVTTVVNSDSGTGTFTGSFGDTSVEVESGATLTTAAARLDGVSVTGEGDVIATNPAGTLDLSGVDVTGGQTISVTRSGQEVSGDLGTFSVNVADDVTFTVDAGTLDGLSVSGAGDLVVTGLDAANAGADFSGISNTGATTFVVTGSLTLTSELPSDSVVTVNAGQTLTLASDLLTDQVVLGNGNVTVELTDGQADLSLILVSGDTFATVAEQTTLDLQAANLGDVPINVSAGSTITLTAEQANGRTVTGDGAVEIVGLNDFPEADLDFIQAEVIQEVPSITINPVTADDLVNQAEANGNVTVSGQVTSSTDAPLQNLTVTVLLGTMVYSATTDASGEWAVNVPKNALYDLGDGEATLTVQVINEQGNQAEVSDTFTIDITAPARPQIALVEDTGSGSADLVTSNGEISVNATEAQWEFTTDGGQTWTAGNDSSFTLPEGAYGSGDVQVRQVDDAGNAGKSASLGATKVDATAPATPELALAEDTGDTGDGVTTNGQINVSGLETGASWEYTTDGGSSWTSGEGISFELTPGYYSEGKVQVRQTDLAGNTGDAVVQSELTVDAPEIMVFNQTSGAAYTSLAEAVADATEGDVLALKSGEFAEDVVIDKSLTLLGANAGEAPVDANGDPLPDLADGVRSADESWINGKITVAAPDVTIDGVRLHNPDGPLDWDESVLGDGGSLDNFQLTNSYLTGYTGNGAPRFNGDGDYNGPAVADGWVIENNFIGGMTDGTGGALYLSGLSNSSVSDNTFWRPAAGHLYVSSLTNTDIDNNNFYHGVHAGGADFDGLLAELQADNGFGYGEYATDGYGYGSDGYGSDGYGDTFFGRNFWIEVKGTNDGISISGNEGQYNSGGIQLYGEGDVPYTFDNITIANNQFSDFINADPEGVLGDGRAQSGFNGAISVSIREGDGHQASNLVISGNTINAAVDQIYSDRDVSSLIYLQGGIEGVELTDNTLDWGASSASVQQLLSELGVTASAYEGNLNGSSLYGGIGGVVLVTGNSLSVDDGAASDIGQISGLFVLEDLADIGGLEGFGQYLAQTTIDGTNSFEGLDPQSDFEVLVYGFTQQQLDDLFNIDQSLQLASVPDAGAQTQSLAMVAADGTGDELLMNFSTQGNDSVTGDDWGGEPVQFLIAGEEGTTLLDLSDGASTTGSSGPEAMPVDQGQWLNQDSSLVSDDDLQAQALV